MSNQIAIEGRLGQDPEVRYTPAGVAVCNLSVASNAVWYTRGEDGERGEKQEYTTWMPVNVWRGQAESCGKYLKKGSRVVVFGEMRGREFEHKDGSKRYVLECRANNVQFMDSAPKSGGGSQEDAVPGFSDDEPINVPDDNIPF